MVVPNSPIVKIKLMTKEVSIEGKMRGISILLIMEDVLMP
jgi:hypothetical protein